MTTPEILLHLVTAWPALDTAPVMLAYLDPGTGSMIVQLLLGGVAGALMVCKLYWHKVRSIFGRHRSQPTGEHPDD